MKVLIINDHVLGGGAESVVRMQFAILSPILDVQFLSGEYIHSKPNFFSYIYSKKSYNVLFDKLVNEKYDIIHLHNYYHLLSPSVLKAILDFRRLGGTIKVVYTAHDYHLVCPNSGFYYFQDGKIENFDISAEWSEIRRKNIDKRSFVHNWLKKRQWKNAYIDNNYLNAIDIITTPSFFLKQVLDRHINKTIKVIRNPITLSSTTLLQQRSKKGIMEIVFFGRLSIEKGLKELIEMISYIKEIKFRLTIIGTGPESKSLKKQVIESKLDSVIEFTGVMDRDALLKILPNFDVFILPSIWYENAPMSIIEAANAGLKIVTTNLGGMVEITNAVGGGNHFEKNNWLSLKHCLEIVREQINDDNSLKGNLSQFSESKYLENILEIYNN